MSKIFDAFDREKEHRERRESYAEVLRILNKHSDREAIVRFRKRTTGEMRTMRFRGIIKTGRDEVGRGLITVLDLDKDAPRRINLDGLRNITIGGRTWVLETDGRITQHRNGREPITDYDERGTEYELPDDVDAKPPEDFESFDAYKNHVQGFF